MVDFALNAIITFSIVLNYSNFLDPEVMTAILLVYSAFPACHTSYPLASKLTFATTYASPLKTSSTLTKMEADLFLRTSPVADRFQKHTVVEYIGRVLTCWVMLVTEMRMFGESVHLVSSRGHVRNLKSSDYSERF